MFTIIYSFGLLSYVIISLNKPWNTDTVNSISLLVIKQKLLTIRVANIEKAEVKSTHERGSFGARLVSSRMRMRMVTLKQKHQENMHHVQKGTVV